MSTPYSHLQLHEVLDSGLVEGYVQPWCLAVQARGININNTAAEQQLGGLITWGDWHSSQDTTLTYVR